VILGEWGISIAVMPTVAGLSCTCHGHIAAPLCCDCTAWAASAQTCALCQHGNHIPCSFYFCLLAPHIHGRDKHWTGSGI